MDILNNQTNTSYIPHLLKYMGSKRELVDFVRDSVKASNISSSTFCDLFAGTGVVSYIFKNDYNIIANDIQEYSAILSKTYLLNLCKFNKKLPSLKKTVDTTVNELMNEFREYNFNYNQNLDYTQVIKIEKEQQRLINLPSESGFSLFTRYYSGTYWSFEQCIWIDAIRCTAEKHKNSDLFYAIMSSLIFAMSYTSQSTGHYAQYRDITEQNLSDILLYRRKDIWSLFEKKFLELTANLSSSTKSIMTTTLDYQDCLMVIPENTIVYADPPYSSVHYSRFYHVLETLVRYDHPEVKHKGRYREDRHQSPFCKKSEVKNAFENLMKGVLLRKSHLILSYSDNGIISKDEIISLGNRVFENSYTTTIFTKEYLHSKMGRSKDRNLSVNELIITFKRISNG